MIAAAVVGAGIAALAVLVAGESRAAKERDLIGAMESVLCVGSSCDIAAGVPEG